MKIKLESLSDSGFQVGYGIKHLSKGEGVEADFSEFGVKLLFGNTWSYAFSYIDIEKQFKVYGQ